MSDKPSQILVPVSDLPPMPLVLADAAFLDGLRVTAAKVKTLSITDAASLADAGSVLNDLTTAGTALEKARVKVKQPFLVICQQIDACAKAPINSKLKHKVIFFICRFL